MQNDDTTIFNFGEKADEVMEELAAAEMHGMSAAQADLVVRMGELLDFAARLMVVRGTAAEALVERAGNHALAMRMHGATLRGLAGATLLEDLCDAISGKYEPEGPIEDGDELTDRMTVAEGMKMLGISKFEAFAATINATVGAMTYWRTRKGGVMPAKHVKIVQALCRGMQAREAA